MAMELNVVGGVSNNKAEVNSAGQLFILPETNITANPGRVGGITIFSENDDGTHTGNKYLKAPETDVDYRLRASLDTVLDSESFLLCAQNTGKHRYGNTTQTITWSTGGVTLNGANVTTTTTGCELRTYAFFPLFGSGSLYVETLAAFTNQPPLNVIVEFGIGLTNNSGTAAPTDGAFFRLTSDGMQCVIAFTGSETTASVPVSWSFSNNEAVKYQLVVTLREVEFWINDSLVAEIPTPVSSGTPFAAISLPWFAQQRHPGTASSALQTKIFNYVIVQGGLTQIVDYDDIGNAIYGSYQGLSGGTMGSLANFANSANPAAAVPTNTTAALGTGLGGQFWETDTLAVTTDGIICSYQVPVGSAAFAGRRLVVKSISIDSFVQTTLTGGGYNAVWSLAFGHTNVSLATTEAATAKAPRRVPLGTYTVAAAAAALTDLKTIEKVFTRPIILNPGEFIAVVKKKVGTAPSAGVIAHIIQIDYGWI